MTHHVQSLSQEVSSRDGGLGLFGFDLSSAEASFWWLEEEQKSKPIHGIDHATVAAEEDSRRSGITISATSTEFDSV